MDKAWTKHIAKSHGVRVSPFIEFSIRSWIENPETLIAQITRSFPLPFYIKALHLGSTFGVHRISSYSQIAGAITSIAKLDYAFLVEEEVQGRELEFGFIGDEVSNPAEVVRSEELHTYENKYSSAGNPSIPNVPLPEDVLQKGKKIAKTIYLACGCSALSRIDFFLDKDNHWILNEVNPMPGMTPMSVYPAICRAEGLSMQEVIDRIVIASLHRYRFQRKHLRPPEKPPVQL
jgi:UDP-N-acetylmuramate--alanine ligase